MNLFKTTVYVFVWGVAIILISAMISDTLLELDYKAESFLAFLQVFPIYDLMWPFLLFILVYAVFPIKKFNS